MSSRSEEEPEFFPEEYPPAGQIDIEPCQVVDEQTANAFLSAPKTSMKDITFIVPGDGPEDTVTMRVSANEWTPENPLWKVTWDCSSVPFKVDRAGLKLLIVDSIAYKD